MKGIFELYPQASIYKKQTVQYEIKKYSQYLLIILNNDHILVSTQCP